MSDNDKPNLLSLLDSSEKIISYTNNIKSEDDFINNSMAFDAVLMNFIVIGETVNRLSDDLKSDYDYIEWIKITNFRNIVAHDYFGIDAEELWQIIKNDVPELISALKKVLKEF